MQAKNRCLRAGGEAAALPASAQEIADVIGRRRALYLIGQLPACGRRSWRVVLYVPKSLPADHWLVRLMGWPDAMKLVRAFGGENLQPSNCRFIHRAYRDRTIRGLSNAGWNSPQIAAAVDLSASRVRSVLAAGPARP
jgi:hypothetical protein